MSAPQPSKLAFVPFVSVENMMRLVNRIGVSTVLTELASYIEEDFGRWELLTKHHASHPILPKASLN